MYSEFKKGVYNCTSCAIGGDKVTYSLHFKKPPVSVYIHLGEQEPLCWECRTPLLSGEEYSQHSAHIASTPSTPHPFPLPPPYPFLQECFSLLYISPLNWDILIAVWITDQQKLHRLWALQCAVRLQEYFLPPASQWSWILFRFRSLKKQKHCQ